MPLRTALVTLTLGAFTILPGAPFAQEAMRAPVTVVDLGTLGHDVSLATRVNDRRQVIGWLADNFEPFRAPFLWEDGVMRELTGPPDLRFDDARDINDRGHIVGYATEVATFRSVAVQWENGRLTRLPAPPGDWNCGADAINDRGDVAGACGMLEGEGVRWRGIVWRDGAIVDLGSVAGAGALIPLEITNHGAILGELRTPEGSSAGSFMLEKGVLTRLEPPLVYVDINDRAEIAAWARLSPGSNLEALIVDHGRFVRLPSLPAGAHCVAAAINAHAAVGGTCTISATVWVRGEPATLPTLSEFAAGVSDVNDRGDAVGYSSSPPEGNAHAVLWPRAAQHPPRHDDR